MRRSSHELKVAAIDPAAGAENRLERIDAAESIAGAAPCARKSSAGQTDSRERPLARRADSTLRPPTVCMRLRKPWLRARRSFEG